MLEIKISIQATEIAEAINNLANALASKNIPQMVCNQNDADNKHIENVGTLNIGGQSTPVVPVAPTPVTQNIPAPAVPVWVPQQTETASVVPTSAPTYTLEDIAKAGTTLVDIGKMDELRNILAKYGVEALTALAPTQYAAFANDLRTLGAQI